MKQLLLILSVGLLTVGSGISQNRYSVDEVVTPGKAPNDTITYVKFDMKPVNGILYVEHDNGQLWFEVNLKYRLDQ